MQRVINSSLAAASSSSIVTLPPSLGEAAQDSGRMLWQHHSPYYYGMNSGHQRGMSHRPCATAISQQVAVRTNNCNTVGPPTDSEANPNSPSRSAQPAIVPTDKDVLMGRGGENNQHSCNQALRDLSLAEKEQYKQAGKKEKPNISRELVAKVLANQGRFLKCHHIIGRMWEMMWHRKRHLRCCGMPSRATTHLVETTTMLMPSHFRMNYERKFYYRYSCLRILLL